MADCRWPASALEGVTRTADAPGQQAMPDPIALIEVLSPGNAADTRDNVWAYTTIPSVREIAVVHSTRVLSEVLRGDADDIGRRSPTRSAAMTRCGSRASA